MKIALLGSGNVATHLGKALQLAGHHVIQVWSRTEEHSKRLGEILSISYTSDLSLLSGEADLYILSVTDDYIIDIASKFPFKQKLLVHTSGSSSLDIRGISGVFYPIQTFSRQKEVDFSNIPIAIEGKDESVADLLSNLALSITTKVIRLNSEQRKALHVAAVFACNFSNHLYAVADSILRNQNLDFDLIVPLVAETTEKIKSNPPASVQTGPAIRKDQITLDSHLQFLEKHSELKELYKLLSQSIINFERKA